MCILPPIPQRHARPIKAPRAAQRWSTDSTCAAQFGTLIQLWTVSTPVAAAGRTGQLPEVWHSNWSPCRSAADFSATLTSSKPWNIESKHRGTDRGGIDRSKPTPDPVVASSSSHDALAISQSNDYRIVPFALLPKESPSLEHASIKLYFQMPALPFYVTVLRVAFSSLCVCVCVQSKEQLAEGRGGGRPGLPLD